MSQKFRFEGRDYDTAELSEAARERVSALAFVDARLQQLQNELAVSDTARMAYASALKREMTK